MTPAATCMPGGGADEAGNRYEHCWVVSRVSETLEWKAGRIRAEPPGWAGAESS